ncbi:hypothetical protein, partial [Streptomyces shenzhenensis]|uniref:hypothetical protein n=1 Tax=Streptomyces shenzhenensis TaxID=943815 RepID=UPI003689BE3E
GRAARAEAGHRPAEDRVPSSSTPGPPAEAVGLAGGLRRPWTPPMSYLSYHCPKEPSDDRER